MDGGVRAIGRGLAVLKVISQNSALDMTSIAKATSLPYPTVCRIVETLIEEGMIEREPGRKMYRPTPMVQTLSYGFRPEDELAAVSTKLINDLTRVVLWPLIVSSRVGSSMMIRTSSHRLSPRTLNMYHPGYIIPILGCSAGIAYLASCDDEERETVLEGMERSDEVGGPYARRSLARTFEDVRRTGYSLTDRCQNNANPGRTSSIAVPVMVGGECVGAVTLTVYSSVMSAAEAGHRYAETIRATGREIADRLYERRLSREKVTLAAHTSVTCEAGARHVSAPAIRV